MDIQIGALLDGKYLVEQILGEGGMGAVFLAENVQIGRKVAIKVLHAELATDDQLLARFRMEARATATIGHPGIVDVLDMGQTPDGAEFIVMERLEGETLGKRIQRRGMLSAVEALPIVIEALDALAAAHDKGIVHRDLKPENLFLVERPVRATKILDFGISKFQDAGDMLLTRTGSVMGTPLYMSPEQARGAKDINFLADLYAMGAILFEALSGRPPFGGTTYNEVLANVLMEPHPPLGSLRPELSAELCTIVDSLLSKLPADRPQHARVAKFQLEQALRQLATDVDLPTERQSAARAAAASIPPHAATRPQAEAPLGAARARRRQVGTIAAAGAALLLGGALIALTRTAATTAGPAAAMAPGALPVTAPVAAAQPMLAAQPVVAAQPILDLAIAPTAPTAAAPRVEPPTAPPAATAPAAKAPARNKHPHAPAAAPTKKPAGLELDGAFPGP